MLNRVETQETESQLVARFVGGLRQQLQHTLNLFRPLSVSEAHQQALTVEAQTRTNFSSWSNTRPPHSSPSLPSSSFSTDSPTDSPTTKPEAAIVPFDNNRTTRTGTLKCFSCGEAGHRQSACPSRNSRGLLLDASGTDVEVIYDDVVDETEDLKADTGSLLMVRRVCLTPRLPDDHPQRHNLFHSCCTIEGKVCKFIIDSGSSENVVAEDVVNKLNIVSEPHPFPYKLAWLEKRIEFLVTRRAMISLSIGDAYKDQIQCDVLPMDACHLLLGRPWIYDRRVQHDGFLNTYSFRFNNRNFTLQPSPPPTQHVPSSPVLLLRRVSTTFIEHIAQIHDQTPKHLEASTSKYKAAADSHRRRLVFKTGDLVWAVLTKDRMPARAYNKLKSKKIGPLEVLERINDNAYRLRLPTDITTSDVFNVRYLSPFVPPDPVSDSWTNPSPLEGPDAAAP